MGATIEYQDRKNGQFTRMKCPCGYATAWRKVGGSRPKYILFQPHLCPKCQEKLSDTHSIR